MWESLCDALGIPGKQTPVLHADSLRIQELVTLVSGFRLGCAVGNGVAGSDRSGGVPPPPFVLRR